MTDLRDDPRFPEEISADELPELEVPPGVLPPWPDELLFPGKKDLALAHLAGLRLPSRIASRHLGAWAAFTGAELERADWAVVRRDVSPTPPE